MESPSTDIRKFVVNASAYNQRRDTIGLKKELEALIPEKEYWTIFRAFLNGHCDRRIYNDVMERHLTTPKARKLHNDFIKAIYYNANFTMLPPPGFTIHKREKLYSIPTDSVKLEPTKSRHFSSYRASDLRCIPSIDQLKKRLENVCSDLTIPNETIRVIKFELARYITNILRECLTVVEKPESAQRLLVIEPKHIKLVLTENPAMMQMLSYDLLSRFSEYL
ncbi:hypothetical protein TVAG_184350 [Trichomonas vaginalis G3]|uniref:Uncharacterized protein n=1 Tax=Trichomonas vaginalis (strain ATCC PRA-98 / G3) TaxID=412133 RepID=A2E9X1_TRIV3|nr:transcriptional adapter 1 family [Trichomonas vaginalis G3]EAY10533.1 hypothetical protein TVAG_184350 [Trichomonas vaginalis G3]KAI5551951.1 transcriptional adapter 1 family [Trichomonas vaginalis G3]|eukprot:XP_001322756.1 hypothetical protein [Trichomonas vaginalis G3]